VVRPWHRLPREAVGDVQGQVGWDPGQPDLVLNLAIGNPAWTGVWNVMILEVPSKPRNSMTL